ncbi:hypothetical protein BCON_0199g00240 [Botryotinia convoluta]|uniref:Uncharacterized protein n=1 Tax=Botryotinia convoluta TaxID=54673 RepID=A0A4Z1HMF8_9HELO|nr:hypothetical protein BCON_0199g00240 [Botryotinia convoluta]
MPHTSLHRKFNSLEGSEVGEAKNEVDTERSEEEHGDESENSLESWYETVDDQEVVEYCGAGGDHDKAFNLSKLLKE